MCFLTVFLLQSAFERVQLLPLSGSFFFFTSSPDGARSEGGPDPLVDVVISEWLRRRRRRRFRNSRRESSDFLLLFLFLFLPLLSLDFVAVVLQRHLGPGAQVRRRQPLWSSRGSSSRRRRGIGGRCGHGSGPQAQEGIDGRLPARVSDDVGPAPLHRERRVAEAADAGPRGARQRR